MSQFLLTKNYYNLKNNEIVLDKKYSDFHHLVDVFRIKKGENVKFLLIDEHNFYTKTLFTKCEDIQKNSLKFTVERIIENFEPKIEINLYQCVPNFDKLTKILEKAVELNCSNIYLVLSKNTNINRNLILTKIKRLEKIIISSVKQSESKFIPSIKGVFNILDLKFSNNSENFYKKMEMEKFLLKNYGRNNDKNIKNLEIIEKKSKETNKNSKNLNNFDKNIEKLVINNQKNDGALDDFQKFNKNIFNIVAYEKSDISFTKNFNLKIQDFLKQNIDSKKLIFNLLIGPEGGLDIEEVNFLKKYNWNNFRLDGNILRVETAFVAVTSILKYEIGI